MFPSGAQRPFSGILGDTGVQETTEPILNQDRTYSLICKLARHIKTYITRTVHDSLRMNYRNHDLFRVR